MYYSQLKTVSQQRGSGGKRRGALFSPVASARFHLLHCAFQSARRLLIKENFANILREVVRV